MGKVSTHSELSKALRQALGVTQAGLAARLLLSRNYISQIEAGLKTPAPRLVAQMEQLLTEAAAKVSNPGSPRVLPRTRGGLIVKEDGPPPMVASRLTPTPGVPSTRQDCEALFADLLDAAAHTGNPNAYPAIYDWLKYNFPAHLRGSTKQEKP